MPNAYLRFAQHKLFWQIRTRTKNLHFRILSRVFGLKYFAEEERANTGILFQVVSGTVRQLLAALILAAALQILELLLINYLIKRWSIPRPDSYVVWLGTVAQIGGVFIALYFTAVTAAAAAIYAQVPTNVRDLLARERWGNVYIRYLTFVTFLPLCLIALHLFGFEPLRLAVPFLILFSGVGIIAFTKLGHRAFNLFDPTRLSYVLFAELNRWIRQVGPGGFRWLDPAFQKHAHRQAAATVDTFEAVFTISATQPNPKGRTLLGLVGHLLNFLAQYQFQKLRIPTGSLWFAEKYRHENWYLTEDSKVQFAHEAGTTLFPQTITEHNWIEGEIERIVLKFFKISILAHRLDDHLELLNRFGGYIGALAANGNSKRAVDLIKSLQTIFQQSRLATEDAGKPPTESMEDIAIAELLSYLHLQALTTYAMTLENRGLEKTKERLQKIRWGKLQSIYTGFFNANEIRQLEWLVPRIALEQEAEGEALTPVWYVQALISKSQAESLQENVEQLVVFSNGALHDWANQLAKEGGVWQSAAVLSRHLEYLRKLETRCLPVFKTHYEALQSAKYLSDLKWPSISPEGWHQQVQQSRDSLNRSVAKHITLLGKAKRPDGVPDYLGQFVHATGESLFGYILTQQADEAKLLSLGYVIGTLVLFDQLKPATAEADVFVEQRM